MVTSRGIQFLVMGKRPGYLPEVLASDWDRKRYTFERVLAEVLAESQNTGRYSAVGTVFMFTFRGVKVKVIKGLDPKKVTKTWQKAVTNADSPEQSVEIGPEYK